MNIVTVSQMQTIEKSADTAGLSYEEMMQNAGIGIADWIYHNLYLGHGVIGLVGSGNNGGDTIIALTALSKRAIRTQAFLVRPRQNDPLLEVYTGQGGAIVDLTKGEHLSLLESAIMAETIILDGILGTGLKLPLRRSLATVMGLIYDLVEKRSGGLVIAVDCPSGVDCDTGEVSNVTLHAEDTLYMAAMKQGLLMPPANTYTGDLHYIDIGLGELALDIQDEFPQMITNNVVNPLLPARPVFGHKGTFGTCLVIAGSAAFTGAAFLTGKGAYRAGCGLVHMASVQDVHQALAGQLIEAVWTVLPNDAGAYDPSGVAALKEVIENVDSIIIGPGFGLSEANSLFIEKLSGDIPAGLPVLFDADGLKLLSHIDNWWRKIPTTTVLTPHPGEMAVLTGLEISQIQSSRWQIARTYANKWNKTVVLKGAVTVIATPDGSLYVNPTSDAALAIAGSGDVLSGIIGGLLAQGISIEAASVSGVWLHATGGKITHRLMGTDVSATALDLLDNIHAAFIQVQDFG